MLTYANRPVTAEQVRGTLGMLRYYKRFLAADQPLAEAWSPECRGDRLNKQQAARRLKFLIHTAINRRAGWPDPDLTRTSETWLDCQLATFLADWKRGVPWSERRGSCHSWYFNKGKFATRCIQRRYGHLLREYRTYRKDN